VILPDKRLIQLANRMPPPQLTYPLSQLLGSIPPGYGHDFAKTSATPAGQSAQSFQICKTACMLRVRVNRNGGANDSDRDYWWLIDRCATLRARQNHAASIWPIAPINPAGNSQTISPTCRGGHRKRAACRRIRALAFWSRSPHRAAHRALLGAAVGNLAPDECHGPRGHRQ
jgi:hypothetical protein